jgi:hypothetical protein
MFSLGLSNIVPIGIQISEEKQQVITKLRRPSRLFSALAIAS